MDMGTTNTRVWLCDQNAVLYEKKAAFGAKFGKTEGKEALGSALVRLRYNGKLYSGNGTSTDIIAASIRAYINALNKIVFEEA